MERDESIIKKILTILLSVVMVFGITGCDKEKEVSIDKLNEINDKIIEYFQANGVEDYENYSYNYVDEANKVVIVGLVDNSQEQQKWFKNNVVNSKYIKFEQGERATTTDEYNSYENIATLHSHKVNVDVLVKFDGILYGKSNSIIDYVGGTKAIGTIDKLIPNIYVPKLNGETNTPSILNALVFEASKQSLILYYNNEYVLFEKV